MPGPGSTWTGPLQSGTIWNPGDSRGPQNVGLAQLQQTITVQANSTAAVTGILYVPYGSQLADFNIDVLTAWTATTATITIGSAAAGSQYVSALSVKTGGRFASEASLVFTSAQLTAMQNVGANTAVYFTVTSTGATSIGTVFLTMFYAQTVQLTQGAA